jgi:hypothetical protein
MNTNISEEPIRIFVSYAHKADKRWFDEDGKHNLIPWLIESLRRQNVIFWYDKGLVPSEVFTRRIEEEIEQARIAILMVSQPFLNSEYIEQHELPRIKACEQQGRLAVLPVLLEPCAWKDDDYLSARHMLPGQPTPLIKYIGYDAEWAEVKFELLDGIKSLVKKIRAEQEGANEVQKKVRQQAETDELQSNAELLAKQRIEQEAAEVEKMTEERKQEQLKKQEEEGVQEEASKQAQAAAAAIGVARTTLEAEETSTQLAAGRINRRRLALQSRGSKAEASQ